MLSLKGMKKKPLQTIKFWATFYEKPRRGVKIFFTFTKMNFTLPKKKKIKFKLSQKYYHTNAKTNNNFKIYMRDNYLHIKFIEGLTPPETHGTP